MVQDTIVITGGNRGIGKDVARQLAEKGNTVIITSRSEAEGTKTASELSKFTGTQIVSFQLDISSEKSVQKFKTNLEKRFEKIDVLVNNAAGFAPWNEFASSTDIALSRGVFETTLFGTWRLIQTLLPRIRMSKNGRIVNVSSGAGSFSDESFGLRVGDGVSPSYGISKLALNGLTIKFSEELRKENISVNAVCPGLTATFPGAEQMGAKPISEGADGIVWAVENLRGDKTGYFYRYRKKISW